MKDLIKKLIRKFGIDIIKYRYSVHQEVVSLKSDSGHRGYVLISYIVEPFFLKKGEPICNGHTNYWESLQIAKTFLDLGFHVDVISYTNRSFIPKKPYSYFVGARTNFERIAELLNRDCIKIAHLDTAHWVFNNYSALKRCLDAQKRRGATLRNIRIVEQNLAIEHADYATVLGNDFTVDTYSYAEKPIFRLPIPACCVYPWSDSKDHDSCRNNFIWFGSGGGIHKGLDLVLEAFAEMPEYRLAVCGPIDKEERFKDVYHKELYETPNIHTYGWVDISSPEFAEIINNCIGLVYPSCSEGQSGAVITCLQAGLIPLISYESGVDVKDFGVILRDCSRKEIQRSVRMIANLPAENLREMSLSAWNYARENHTREKYAAEYKRIIDKIMNTEL